MTLVVGLVLAGTLLTSMQLTATGLGAEGRSMGEHGPGGGAAVDSGGGDRGHDREGGDTAHDRPPGETGNHSAPACP